MLLSESESAGAAAFEQKDQRSGFVVFNGDNGPRNRGTEKGELWNRAKRRRAQAGSASSMTRSTKSLHSVCVTSRVSRMPWDLSISRSRLA